MEKDSFEFKVWRTEPFYFLLIEKLKWNPFKVWILFFVLIYLTQLFLCFVDGTAYKKTGGNVLDDIESTLLDTQSTQRYYINTYHVHITHALIYPGIIALIIILYKMISDTFNCFLHDKLIKDKERYKAFLKRIDKQFNFSWKWNLTIIIIIIALATYYAFEQHRLGRRIYLNFSGWTIGPWHHIIFINALMWYIYAHLAIRIFFLMLVVRDLFTLNTVEIDLFHSDNCGGFKKVGDVVALLFLIIVMLGLALSVFISNSVTFQRVSLSQLHLTLLGCIGYLISIPIIYFGILRPFARKMWITKQRLIFNYNQRYGGILGSLYDCLLNSDVPKLAKLKDVYDELQFVKSIRDEIRSAPVWPFETKNIMIFLSVFFIPVILPLIFDKMFIK